MHDFSIYKESLMELGGARSKISIIDDKDNNIMLKLQEDNTYFYISEYIAYKLASRNMDETMKCLSDEKYLKNKILKYPTSPIRLTINKKTNYVDLINAVVNIFGKERLVKFSQDYAKIDLDRLFDDKDLMEYISDIDVMFYKKVIQMRFDLIIRGVLNV